MAGSEKTISPSALGLALLLLLWEGPMHPYQMHRMLRDRRKEDVLGVRPAAIYGLVERLEGAGLVEPLGTSREGRRPERTVYRITDRGRAVSDAWLREMLGTPAREYPAFPAALSMAGVLLPGAVAQVLGRRATTVEAELARIDAELAQVRHLLARVHLLEVEHARAVLRAELEWLQAVVAEIGSGALTWDPGQLMASEAPRRERLADAEGAAEQDPGRPAAGPSSGADR